MIPWWVFVPAVVVTAFVVAITTRFFMRRDPTWRYRTCPSDGVHRKCNIKVTCAECAAAGYVKWCRRCGAIRSLEGATWRKVDGMGYGDGRTA